MTIILSLLFRLVLFLAQVSVLSAKINETAAVPGTAMHANAPKPKSKNQRRRQPTQTQRKLLPVVLLAGQSNMEGWGSVRHLKELVQSNDSYPELWNGTEFTESERIYMIHNIKNFERGPLTVGFGGNHAAFGPELGIGWVLDEALSRNQNTQDEKMLLIKSAYGGKSLAVDFRPPSAEPGNYSDLPPGQNYSFYYKLMMHDFHSVLDHLAVFYPSYTATYDGFELIGFVWFQGWNDMIRPDFVQDYSVNLVHLVEDLNRDFKRHYQQTLPLVVVGELGMAGLHPTGPQALQHLAMREQQRQAVEEINDKGEIKKEGTQAVIVRTTPYVHEKGTHYNHLWHYYGRADTYYPIGRAFGRALLEQVYVRFQHALSIG